MLPTVLGVFFAIQNIAVIGIIIAIALSEIKD